MGPTLHRIHWREGLPWLETERLVLRLPRLDEGPKIARFLVRNREHAARWEPDHEPWYYTDAAWRNAPESHRNEAHKGSAFRFRALWKGDEGEFVGHMALTEVAGGASWSGTLGYTVDVGAVGRGVATEMGLAVVAFAFETLDLHRIEACAMPANMASHRVLEKLGFEREGLLRGSMHIAGSWEDHLIWGLINPAWRGGHPRLPGA